MTSAASPERRVVYRTSAQAIRPDPIRTVAEWADAERHVSAESGSSRPGRWTTSLVPYLREVMEKLSLSHPATRVTFRKSAQVGGTEAGVNLLGQIMAETPAPCMVVLPTRGEAQDYNRLKLDPTIRATPKLRAKVREVVSRDEKGSTLTFKAFPGGFIQLAGANVAKQLEMRTVRVLIFEEISKYPRDVEGRGRPTKLAMSRTDWFTGREKVFDCSTPHLKGDCQVSEQYEAGSRAHYAVPCPHCGHEQELTFKALLYDAKAEKPEIAQYACEACVEPIEERHKAEMLERGRWIHERPEYAETHPSYRINALYSPILTWTKIAQRYVEARNDPTGGLKPFTQQVLGEAWDEAYDLPKAEILLTRRDKWQPGRVPPGVLTLMGATDVQGDRLEWAVWGFDRRFGQWLIDTGVLEGDPTRPEVWQQHDALLKRRWTDAWGKDRAPDVWGIDSSYLSQQVYGYVRRHSGDAAPELRALDGRPGWRLPAIGTPVMKDVDWAGQKIGSVQLWPVGTWDMKSELTGALRLTEQGPGPEGWPHGALRFNEMVDRTWLDQLLAEQCVEDPRTGKREWKKVNARNEAWDLAVYARALARQATERLTPEAWDALEAERSGMPDAAQADLAALWAPDLKAQAEAAAKAKAERPPMPPPPRQRPAAAPWIEPRTDWI